jgi:hypothetical protein
MGSTCLGGGAGREALRAVTMTAFYLLTILLDLYITLSQMALRDIGDIERVSFDVQSNTLLWLA